MSVAEALQLMLAFGGLVVAIIKLAVDIAKQNHKK